MVQLKCESKYTTPSRPGGPATPSRPDGPGGPSLPSLPGSPGLQDAVVASAASVVWYTAVKQVRATRNLTVRGSIFSCRQSYFEQLFQNLYESTLSSSSDEMIPVTGYLLGLQADLICCVVPKFNY